MEFMPGWVICPPEDSKEHDNDMYFGVRQDAENYRFAIVTGCCADLMVRATTYNAQCSFCYRQFAISDFDGFRGEDVPFQLYWGMFPWDQVEERMQEWIDFYFNLKARGEVQFQFDGKTRDEYVETEFEF